MAEFLWTFAVQEVLKTTVKLAAEQLGMAWGFKKELSKLRDSLLMVEAILRDVDRIKAEHHAVKLWVHKLENIVFEADVLLDELAYEDLRRKAEIGKKVIMVSNFVSSSKNPIVFRLKMAHKIKVIAKMLEEHYFTASAVGLIAITSSKETELDLSQIQETDSIVDEFGVIGREVEVSEIVNKLIDLSNREVLSVIPIVGMGGLGKTSLAKVIFNHELIRGNFDTTIWVCVSEPFIIKKILRTILETLNANLGGVESKEVLLQELQKLLNDKRYFLVLDDVWNENPNLWYELKDCLVKITRKFGCAIVVTTRSDEVAEIMETHGRHHLRKLSNDHCWSLFEKCAFANELPKTPELDKVRGELVEKFGGIPLVVKVLGGMVKLDKNREGLLSTLKNLMRILLQDENIVLSTIKLSVDRLPSSLKQCFAYCSNFPQDFKFRKEELIQMWIAQGFIQPPERSKVTMEDIGDKYINILFSRSLFQDVIKDKRERIIYFKMHDLIHDVACAISNSQKLKFDVLDSLDGKPWRGKVLSIGHIIRTLGCSENDGRKFHMLTVDIHVFNSQIKTFIYLRVLIARSWYIEKLSDSIAKLKHLRYLDIKYSCVKKLPKSFVLLYNLQTLRLGSFFKDFPKDLKKLVQLRHLEFSIDPLVQTKQMPQYLGRLIQLQTLSSFIVGFDEGCKIEELGPLKNLKGKLRILCLERVKSKKEAMTANLVEKENISDLHFQWGLRCEREGSNYNDLDVLEGLQPHKNLEALRIQNYASERLPNGIFVEMLVEIYLHDCEKCETLPMLGQLSNLEVLEIRCLHSVRSIGDEFYGNYRNKRTLFPKLKTFQIFEMNSLVHWKEITEVSNCATFPRLESLSIVCCLKLMNIPNLFASCHPRLEVDGVHARLFTSFEGPVKLRSLKILGCEELTKLPGRLEFCNSLENMWISNCSNLNSPPNLQNMHRLSVLSIRDFQKLPEGLAYLLNLKHLSVHGCLQNYDWSPLINLSSLEHLILADLGSGAAQLPQQLEQLTTLRSLHISHFDGIEALPEWFGNLTSLETLKLYNCKNLKSLSFKEAMMSNMGRLNSVRVYGCPQLELGSGEFELVKTSHGDIFFIPEIKISK